MSGRPISQHQSPEISLTFCRTCFFLSPLFFTLLLTRSMQPTIRNGRWWFIHNSTKMISVYIVHLFYRSIWLSLRHVIIILISYDILPNYIFLVLQLGAMINVLPHFSTNIPFDIKWRKRFLHSPLIISFNQFTIWANKTGPRFFTLLQVKLRIEVQAYLIKLFIRWLISLYDIAFILDAPMFSRPKWKRYRRVISVANWRHIIKIGNKLIR